MEKVSLYELVCIFNNNHMILHIDSPKIEEIGNLLEEQWRLTAEDKVARFVWINSLGGKGLIAIHLLYGFYFRPASETANSQFQRKIIELQERAVKAVEDVNKDCIGGDEWKK